MNEDMSFGSCITPVELATQQLLGVVAIYPHT